MQAEIDTNKQVTKIAELKLFVRDDKEGYKDEHQHVFEQPVANIGSANKRVDPCSSKNEYEYLKPRVLQQWLPVGGDGNSKAHKS
jgi:hypothetical protein